MSLPHTIVDFLAAWESLTPHCVRHEWGTVTADTRFPDVWDANRAMVAGETTASLDDVLGALEVQRRLGTPAFEHVELVDVDAHPLLHDTLQAHADWQLRFALMIAGGADSERPAAAGVTVAERAAPDEQSWRRAKERMHEGEIDIPEPALRQMIHRDALVFFPAGRRLFEAQREGETAGMATLLSLHGVGLVDDVVTAPRHRRHGVTTALMRSIAQASRDAGDTALILFTAEDGNARRLYERLGFRVIALSGQFHRELASSR